MLERLRESFNANSLALAAAEAALGDQEHVARARSWNLAEREWLAASLGERGLRVLPSQTNFVLAEFGRDAAPIEDAIVSTRRDCAADGRIRIAAVPAHQRRIARRERGPAVAFDAWRRRGA